MLIDQPKVELLWILIHCQWEIGLPFSLLFENRDLRLKLPVYLIDDFHYLVGPYQSVINPFIRLFMLNNVMHRLIFWQEDVSCVKSFDSFPATRIEPVVYPLCRERYDHRMERLIRFQRSHFSLKRQAQTIYGHAHDEYK